MADGELGVEKIYAELCADIRITDDISFKLLGLVPLVSGTGLLALVLGLPISRTSVLLVLSLFAAAITWGVWRWELRNIQRCRQLIDDQRALANAVLKQHGITRTIGSRSSAPQGFGKQQGENVIYGVTVLTWLAVPSVLADWTSVPNAVRVVYVLMALALLLLSVWTIRAQIPQAEAARPAA